MNRRKKELPLIEPVYSTFHHQGASAIIASNPSIRNWYLNEKMILKCSHRFLSGYSAPDIDILESSWYNNPYFERIWFNLRLSKGYINPIIRDMINEGYYACYSGVDDYYIKGKTWYRQRHFLHDGMIYGYDQECKTYSMFAYDIKWVYSKIIVPQSCFNKGRIAATKRDPEYNDGFVCAVKPTSEHVEFCPKIIIENIRKYLDSSFDKYPIDSSGDVLGIVVHDYIAMYIDKLIDGSIAYDMMDYRVFRMIWEHKKVMLERLSKVEQALGFTNSTSENYSYIVSEADNMRMLYASYHMKRRDSILPIIRKKLIHLKEEEKKILSEFVIKATR